jgi:hypothetical protein
MARLLSYELYLFFREEIVSLHRNFTVYGVSQIERINLWWDMPHQEVIDGNGRQLA